MKSLKYLIGILLIVVVVGAGCTSKEAKDFGIADKDPDTQVNASGYYNDIQKIGGDKTLVRPSDIIESGQGRGGFPKITNPEFVSVEEMVSRNILFNDMSGVSIKDGDTYKFYPHQILAWHVIVEDEVNQEAVAVTYSQLTEVSKVFKRDVNNIEVSFDSSGMLWNNNVLLYDDNTETLWSQILGRGVYGENTGVELEEMPSVVMTWGQWKKAYPNGLVLSDNTGFERAYKRGPYGEYLVSRSVLFPLINKPVRALEPKSVIVGVITAGGTKAYQEGPLVEVSSGVKNDVIGETDVVIWRRNDGAMFAHESEDIVFNKITDNGIMDSEGNEWLLDDNLNLIFEERVLYRANTIQTFWFIWSTLNPDSHIYGRIIGKGLVDGAVMLTEDEGVKEDSPGVTIDINDPNFGSPKIETLTK